MLSYSKLCVRLGPCFPPFKNYFTMFSKFHTSAVTNVTPHMTDKAFIDGKWIETEKKFAVNNPFNGDTIGFAADCDEDLAKSSVESAADALSLWQEKTVKQRSRIMRKWFDSVVLHKDTLTKLLTLENGKPLIQAAAEIDYAADFIDWFAEEGRRTYGINIPTPSPSKRMMTIKQPIGVVSMITPWNFPAAMVTRKVVPALVAGCSVVLKPSEETPFSALAMAQLAEDAGVPSGVFNVLPCSRSNSGNVGKGLCTHPSVAGISFTGSTATSKILLEHAASTVKKVSLENGGNAPFIVFDSADVDKAVKGLLACKFRNSGQTCVSANRVLVHSAIHDQFVSKFTKTIKDELVLGSGMDPRVNIGPLINEQAVMKVESHVKDAVDLGARVVLGGKLSTIGKNIYEPTVITDVSTSMRCVIYESFGPIAPIMKFETEQEAIDIANETSTGLAGYVYSSDLAQCWRVSEKLEVGVVGINEGLVSAAEGAFGGVKESGLGREGSIYGMDEFMEVKYVCWGVG